MAVITVNGLSGITSITSQSGTVEFYDSAGNIASFTGNISGNINSTGIITASQIKVGTGITITGGIVTATTFSGQTITGITTAGISTVYVTSINEGQLQGYRNMLYNGAMVVNQRGYTSAASTSLSSSSNTYVTDRYQCILDSDAVVAIGQSTSVAAQPTGQGFTNSLHWRVTTADSSLSVSQVAYIQQVFEGYDIQRIKKGSSNAEPVTLSFWVRSSKIGTYICELYDIDNTRQCSKSYTIGSANTWEKKIVTFPADTTGAIDNDNDRSLSVVWWLAAGSNYTSGTLNTSWASVTTANRLVGQVNFLDTAGAQFNLTGCQLEVGPNATDFEFRSYGDDLQLCRRYYKKGLAVTGNSGQTPFGSHYGGSNGTNISDIDMPSFRTAPNLSLLNNSNVQYYSYGGAWTASTLTITSIGIWPSSVIYLYSSADGDGRGKLIRCTNATDVHWVADAEF